MMLRPPPVAKMDFLFTNAKIAVNLFLLFKFPSFQAFGGHYASHRKSQVFNPSSVGGPGEDILFASRGEGENPPLLDMRRGVQLRSSSRRAYAEAPSGPRIYKSMQNEGNSNDDECMQIEIKEKPVVRIYFLLRRFINPSGAMSPHIPAKSLAEGRTSYHISNNGGFLPSPRLGKRTRPFGPLVLERLKTLRNARHALKEEEMIYCNLCICKWKIQSYRLW